MKKFLMSFYYAIEGIKSAFKSEFNMKIHTLIMLIVIICGFIFKINYIEWISIIISIALVIGSEIINTSIETLTNLVTKENNIEAGKTKDLAAGAVLVFAVSSVIVGLIIFLPKFINLLGK